jgi:elongation factor Ts
MADITAAMVKELRERTGAGMMDCKTALTQTNGDFEEAVVFLRKKFGNKLSDRQGRTTSEGVVAVWVLDRQDGAIVELNSETDFVARNADFKEMARELAEQVVREKGHNVETVLTQKSVVAPGSTVQERLHDIFTRLRENIVFRRFELISTDEKGSLSAYVHVPANDKIGVLVELEAATAEAAKTEAVQTVGREIAMQIAAARPRYLRREDVPAEVQEREKDVARAQAQNEGRPEAAIEKIVEGRLRKYYEETVLVDQVYLRDPKKTVAQVLKDAGVSIRRFVRFEVGEQVTGAQTSGAIKEQAE